MFRRHSEYFAARFEHGARGEALKLALPGAGPIGAHIIGKERLLVVIGGIVAGDILMGDAANPEQWSILQRFDKALAFEMEAFGVARAVFKSRDWVHYNPQFLVVRGISDLVDVDPGENQATRVAWTPYAVATAGAFTQALVERVLSAPQPNFAPRVTLSEFISKYLRRRR